MVQLPAVTETDFTVTPEGIYIMSLKDFEDGIEGNPQFGGGERCRWVFQIEQVVSSLDEDAEDQVGEEFWAWTSKNMSKRANMYKYICALMGRTLEAGENANTDDLMGRKVKVQVIEYDKADGSVGTKIGGMQPFKANNRKKAAVQADNGFEADADDPF